jgi:5-epi-alpha-selinene synthase
LCDTMEATRPDYLHALATVETRLIELGQGAVVRADDDRLARSLAHIRARAAESASHAWLERLGRHIREYIEGCRWERLIRLEGEIPSLATYSKLRLLISAVFPCFDLAGIHVDGARTDFADHVLVKQLEVMANNYVSWVNDIYGLGKEIEESTTSNLVIVIAHQFELDWDEALDRAIEMCNSELEAFVVLERQLDLLVSGDCRAYVRALASWMRGNLDWYSETRRYDR